MTKLTKKFQKLKERLQAGVEGFKSRNNSPTPSIQSSIDSASGASPGNSIGQPENMVTGKLTEQILDY